MKRAKKMILSILCVSVLLCMTACARGNKDNVADDNTATGTNEEKKNEPLQLVKKGYGIAGGIFLVVGLLFGYAGPQLTANLLKFQMPAIWNAVYLVAAVGIYMLFVYFIV